MPQQTTSDEVLEAVVELHPATLPPSASVRRAWNIDALHPRRSPPFTLLRFSCHTAGQIT